MSSEAQVCDYAINTCAQSIEMPDIIPLKPGQRWICYTLTGCVGYTFSFTLSEYVGLGKWKIACCDPPYWNYAYDVWWSDSGEDYEMIFLCNESHA